MSTPYDMSAMPSRIAEAGRAASAVMDVVRRVDVTGVVGAVGVALPGSTTAAHAGDLGSRWQNALAGLADAFAAHARALTDSAAAYRSNEQLLVDALRTPAPGGPYFGSGLPADLPLGPR